MTVPSYDALHLGSRFVVSGWFMVENAGSLRNNPRLFSRKMDYRDKNGYEVELNCVNPAHARGSSQEACYFFGSGKLVSWTSITVCYDGDSVSCYTNGIQCTLLQEGAYASDSIAPVTDNGLCLAFGSNSGGDEGSLYGQYDEIRLRGGSLSADRIKADYDMIADRNWLAYGIVRKTGAADAESMGGVQLWENGPYWAECNVGATKPEEYGYYFWWGDTVGYKRVGDSWNAVDGSRTGFSFEVANCPTYGKGNPELWADGYADLSGHLAAAHDAATACLGAPWRMPTDAEYQALIDNCTTTWITTNGVAGRLVTGKGDYASKSIFLPAAGYGRDSRLLDIGSLGNYWSSTPDSDNSNYAWYLRFLSGDFRRNNSIRSNGRSVRPLRVFAE